MKRSDFLKGFGVLSLGSLVPVARSRAAVQSVVARLGATGSCVLIPNETQGPYQLDLSSDPGMFRQDITEGNTGTPMELTLTVVNINDNCEPLPDVRVDIWHCNKDGYYSGFNNQPGYLGTQNHAGETFFRGIQITDVNGQVRFTTVYPGWYPGRVTHIHFQVFLNSVLAATSQMAFDETITTAVYNSALYSAHGQNPTTNNSDNVFSDANNTQYQMLNLVSNGLGGYDGSLVIGIQAPTTGLIELEPETGGQFKLQPIFPNPADERATLAFRLKEDSNVAVTLFDLQGKKLNTLFDAALPGGDQQVTIDFGSLIQRPSAGSYIYEFRVTNRNGSFHQNRSISLR